MPIITRLAVPFAVMTALVALAAPAAERSEVRAASGFNITSRRTGEELHTRLVGLLDDGAIEPVIGDIVAFDDLPAALERMEERSTIGRVVVDLAGVSSRTA